MDRTDEKILEILIENSRLPISQIAKRTRISRDIAQYRISRLKSEGIIRDFTTDINQEKLGYISALFFVCLKAEAEGGFIDYINKLDFVSWAGTHLGFWSMGMAIYGKDTKEVEERFQTILNKYKTYITDHRFAFYKTTKLFSEKYFNMQKKYLQKNSHEHYEIDSKDKTILRHLANNSRSTSVEIAKSVSLTAVAVSQRITKLEKSGYIRGYSIYINTLKLGVYLFVFFIQNRNLDQRKKLYSYLENHPRVSLLLDYIGDPFIEFGIFVKDPYDARAILQEIKETFPDNKLVDFFLAQEDFISFGAPKCVFE